jgi:N-acetylneuraminic acid mutarotase
MFVALAVATLGACGSGSGSGTASGPTEAPTTVASAPRAVQVAIAPWRLQAPTSREVVLTDGTHLLVFGGQDATHSSTAMSWQIDPHTGSATALAALSPAVHDAAGVRVHNDNLIIAGGTPPPRATVQAIPPTGAAQTRGQLPADRTDHVAAVLNDEIFIFGGAQDEGLPVATIFTSTDTGATWHDAGTLSQPVRYPAIAAVNDIAYLFGGVTTANGTDTTAIQRYDPHTRTTTDVAQLPAPLSHASAIAFGANVFVVGGYVNNIPSNQILRYDTTTNTITTAGTLPGPLTDAAAIVIDHTGYLLGGEGPGRTTTANVELITPS